jgi:DeoR/GlpR family transcriptional regulator of sugar metabolism
MAKLYQSEAWLRREFLTKKKKPAKIAEEQRVSEMTIRRYLEKFGLLK